MLKQCTGLLASKSNKKSPKWIKQYHNKLIQATDLHDWPVKIGRVLTNFQVNSNMKNHFKNSYRSNFEKGGMNSNSSIPQ